MKDATTKSTKEEFVIGMEEGRKQEKLAITKDAPTNPIQDGKCTVPKRVARKGLPSMLVGQISMMN